MKLLKKLLFSGIIFILILPSCTVTKRVHMPGYHVDWNNRIQTKQKLDDNTKEQNISLVVEKTESKANKKKKHVVSAVSENIKTELNGFTAVKPSKNVISKNNENKIIKNNENPFAETNVILTENKKIKSYESNEDGGNKALRVIGWVVLIIGFLFLLLISILIGALLMLLGLIFILAGKKKKGSSQTKKETEKSQYEDVVYLKNGSIIRGMIIEQIPNVSLKIKTEGGSVFYYRMEEVKKISKELSE